MVLLTYPLLLLILGVFIAVSLVNMKFALLDPQLLNAPLFQCGVLHIPVIDQFKPILFIPLFRSANWIRTAKLFLLLKHLILLFMM